MFILPKSLFKFKHENGTGATKNHKVVAGGIPSININSKQTAFHGAKLQKWYANVRYSIGLYQCMTGESKFSSDTAITSSETVFNSILLYLLSVITLFDNYQKLASNHPVVHKVD